VRIYDYVDAANILTEIAGIGGGGDWRFLAQLCPFDIADANGCYVLYIGRMSNCM